MYFKNKSSTNHFDNNSMNVSCWIDILFKYYGIQNMESNWKIEASIEVRLRSKFSNIEYVRRCLYSPIHNHPSYPLGK